MKLRVYDQYLRYVLVPTIAAVAIYSIVNGAPAITGWLQAKLLVFAAAISLGLYLRAEIKQWIIGFGHGAPGRRGRDKGNTIIEQSLIRSRRGALLLWFAVALAAFLGKVKPFS